MLIGLRASDAAILQRLCGDDQRLFLRLGNLLQAKLAVTEPALMEIVASAGLKKLALDKRLRGAATADFPALLAEVGAGDSGMVLIDDRSGKVEAGWRVLAMEDEVDNPLLAGAPLLADATPALVAEVMPGGAPPGLGAILATLSPAVRAPVEGLIKASADDQRAAALEQLRYATPPLAVVSELMPMILADGAELVRERAVGVLVAAGAHTAVVDLCRALQKGDNGALTRLADNLGNLPTVQLDLVLAALMAHAGRGHASQALVGVCQHLAAHLADHRSLDRLMELLLPARLSLVGLVRALQHLNPARINDLLHRFLGHGAESDARAIILLAAPGQPGDERLLDRGIELLVAVGEEPQERMALAAALRRLEHARRETGAAGASLAERIAAYGLRLAASRDTTVYWLLGELCRDGAVPLSAADALAALLRKLLREAPGPHLVALLEQQLPALLPAGELVRAGMVEPLVEIVARFRDERSHDLVANALVKIGVPAVPPLWQLLEEHPHPAVRLLATRALAELLVAADGPAAAAAVKRLLAGLAKSPAGAERGALLTAAARVANGPGLDGDGKPATAVDAAAKGQGEWAIEALGHLGAGRHVDPGRRAEILELLLSAVLAELPDAPMQQSTDPNTQDTTFVIDTTLGIHTENVPRLLASIQRIGCSPHLPPQLLRRLVDRLCHQWNEVSSWRTVWGPGNTQELGKVLGQLAERPDFPGPLRLMICEALLPRISHLVVARALARVFTTAEGSFLSELAGKAGERLVKLASDGHFSDDELDELLETEIDYLAIPHLGPQGDVLRRRLSGLISAKRARVGSRAKARLRELMERFDEEIRQRLEWA